MRTQELITTLANDSDIWGVATAEELAAQARALAIAIDARADRRGRRLACACRLMAGGCAAVAGGLAVALVLGWGAPAGGADPIGWAIVGVALVAAVGGLTVPELAETS